MHIHRKRLAKLCLYHAFIFIDDKAPPLGCHFRIKGYVFIALMLFKDIFEFVMIDAQYDIAVHLDEAAVTIPRKTRIA